MDKDNLEKQDSEELEGFIPIPRHRPKWRRFAFGFWIMLLIIILLGLGGLLIYKTGFTFYQISVGKGEPPLNENTPLPDPDRLNILILGLRGETDPNGGLLTDSIMIVSLKKSTGQVALISLPRDIYLKMPGQNSKEKINFAYALGFEKKGATGGLLYSKIAAAKVTGLNFNYALAVDHQAFKEIVDILGGIDIYLDKPFVEDQQWVQGGDAGPSSAFAIRTEIASTSAGLVKKQKWVFAIPAGTSHLDGNTTLYFMRARFSTSDFDRSRRQQMVLSAIKEKAFSLGVLTNPLKLYQLLGTLGRNVRTDMTFNNISELIGLARQVDTKNIVHKFFDTAPDGLLYESRTADGSYILLPVGDNFSKIQEACRNMFN